MPWIGTKEAAIILGKGETTIKRACTNGSLGLVCKKSGNKWEIEESSVRAVIENRVENNVPESQNESESKFEYERRIKREDWIKKQRENKIKAGEYAKISTAVAISVDYIDETFNSLREKIEKLVLTQKITKETGDLFWNEIIKSSEEAKQILKRKIENVHI